MVIPKEEKSIIHIGNFYCALLVPYGQSINLGTPPPLPRVYVFRDN